MQVRWVMFSARGGVASKKDKGGYTYATLGDGVDILAIDGAKEGKGEDSDRLHLDCWGLGEVLVLVRLRWGFIDCGMRLTNVDVRQ